EAKGERLLDEFARVSLQKTETTARLKELLSGLWPIHVTDIQNRVTGLSSWANADRQFTWMAAIYERIMQEFEKLETQSETLSRNLADQKRIKKALQSEVAEVESTKDELLKEKLSFLRKVQEVRVMKLKQEEQLQAILSTVESMEFELHTLTDRSFSRLQGHLPWPGNGKIVSTFNPSANPPKRGIGIVVHDNQPVTAVSWGKVVHNDQLRGFGRVVILSQGEEYYTLYAYLSESHVKMGQKVEKGEPIGTTGFYPQADGPGLYFELRFGQKAVNPMDWLSSSG
ncbi:MAG: murein hydrolase activator EnvC family protein, partial [Desulfovibrionales bacterium]